ncbi:transposase [Patescibacteria group bacterium AH-259-L07]|nr:transposase [Patescibacteria group bacterium AH-259-L07]
MRKRITFVNNQFYHIYNRGVEKRDIFMNEKDYVRFIHDLYEFNDKAFAQKFQIVGGRTPDYKKRDRLVNILCFCLMPNHFHFILEQLQDNGISYFMQKLGGYTTSFNLKYNRVGALFQGKYKAIHIDNENYLLHLSRYIHLNPVELVEPKWKERGVKNRKKVNEVLESHRWSSYLDYIGKKNFPSVINKDLINGYFESPEEYKKFVMSWLVDDMDKIEKLILEK